MTWKRITVSVLTLLVAWTCWARRCEYLEFGGDALMLRHAVLGDPDWWHRVTSVRDIWRGYLYHDKTWVYEWATLGSDIGFIYFMYVLGIVSYLVIAWHLVPRRNGFLLSLVGLRFLSWYLSAGNIALGVGLLSLAPVTCILAWILKPTAFVPLAVHAYRAALGGGDTADDVSGPDTVLAVGGLRLPVPFPLGEQVLYILCAWFYVTYTLSDHFWYWRGSWPFGWLLWFLPT